MGMLAFVSVAMSGAARLDGIAKSHGIPMSAEELKAPCKVPDAENAYPLFLKYSDAYKAESAAAPQKLELPSFGWTMPGKGSAPTGNMPPFDPAKANDYLKYFPASLRAAAAMTNRSGWFVDRNMSNPAATLYPEFADLKKATKLILLDAELKLSKGDREGAMEEYRKASQIGDFSNSEPVLIGTLVYIACHSMILDSIAHEAPIIAADPVAEKKAMALLAGIQKPNLALAMKGEGFYEYFYAKHGFPGGLLPNDDSDEGGGISEATVTMINSTRGVWGPELVSRIGTVCDSVQGNNYQGFVTQAAITDKWLETRGLTQIVAGFLMPVFTQSGLACEKLLASRDLVRIGLSAVASGRPPSVDGTVDPFSGRPYKVVSQAHGWEVYSVGTDGVDGGGTIDPGHPSQSKDIIFSYNGQGFLVGR